MADTTTQDIILRVGITGDEAVTELKKKNLELLESTVKNQKAINDFRDANKELMKTEGDHSQEIAKNVNEINELKNVNKLYQAEIKNNMNLITAEDNSLQQHRAQLSLLTAQYNNMKSDDEASAAAKKKLGTTIDNLTTQLKAEEKQIGQTHREVGNYTDSIVKAMGQHGLGNTAIGIAMTMYGELKNKIAETTVVTKAQTVASEGQAVATEGAAASTGILNGAFKLLLANPVIAVIAAIAALFFLVKDAIESSSTASNALNEVMAPLKQVFNLVLDIVGKVVTVFLQWVKSIEEGVEWVLKFIGIMDKHDSSVEKSMQVEKQRQELRKQGRKDEEEAAVKEKEIADLRNKIAQKDKYNTEERRDMMKKALKLEEEVMESKRNLAKDELKNLQDQAELRGHSTSEELSELSKAKIKIENIEKDSLMSTRRMQTQRATFEIEIQKDREAAIKKRIDAERAVEDVLLAMMKEGQDKEQELLYANHSRALDDAKYNNKLRLALTDKYNVDKKLIDDKYSEKAQKDALDSAMKEVEQRLSLIKKGSEEELQLKIDKLNLEEEKELEEAEKKGENTQLIIQKYLDLETQTRLLHQADLNKKILDNEKLHHQNLLDALKLNNENTLKEELNDALLRQRNLGKILDTDTEEEIKAKQTVALEIKNINKSIVDNEEKSRQDKIKIAQLYQKGLSSLLDIFGENAEANAGFAKALAIFQIGIDTATGISGAIKAGAGLVFPANLGAILMGVTSVLAGIASAKKALDGAGSTPKAPKARGFSVGGNVWGDGTGTSDSINARLSHGESVNNAMSSAMFAPIYSALNQAGGGVPIQTVNKSAEVYGENFLANAFMKAAMSMPSPVVSVEEYSRVANRVAVIETLAKQ